MNILRELPYTLIDVFEDFLREKGIDIPNKEKEGDETEAIIFGEDFDLLHEKVIEALRKYGVNV